MTHMISRRDPATDPGYKRGVDPGYQGREWIIRSTSTESIGEYAHTRARRLKQTQTKEERSQEFTLDIEP